MPLTETRPPPPSAPSQPAIPPSAATQLAAVLDGSVRVGPLQGIPALLRDLGVDPFGVFATAGVDLSLFDDAENTLTFRAGGRLLATAAAVTGCDHFGLLLGQRTGLECLGLVGMLAASAANLEQALRTILLYLHLHDRGAIPTFSVAKGEARLGYTIYQPHIEGTAQIYDLAMAITFNSLRTLCGPAWRPHQLFLSRARPADPTPYRAFFGVRPRFESDQSSWVFSSTWLAHPPASADPLLHQELLVRIEALTGADRHDVSSQVRRITCNLLLCGGAALGSVAEVLSLHPRTLNRQLQVQGTTYRELRDQCRHALASQLLRETELPVAEIAARLDYADAASFTRAFRRWSGQAPALWRSARRPR